MNQRFVLIGMVSWLWFHSDPVAAQQIAVQQPVVGVFQVNTTVSVPDRGGALLGGVRSAASGRSNYGPFRSGTSLGLSREPSTATAHVTIHDLAAMDEALLAAAKSERTSYIDPRIAGRLEQRSRLPASAPEAIAGENDLAVQAERLAEQAEARGKFAVAKLHWQRAARHGSDRAGLALASEKFHDAIVAIPR